MPTTVHCIIWQEARTASMPGWVLCVFSTGIRDPLTLLVRRFFKCHCNNIEIIAVQNGEKKGKIIFFIKG